MTTLKDTPLTKPLPDAKGQYRYFEVMSYLEAKFGFQATDYYDSHSGYTKWCQKHAKPTRNTSIEVQQRTFREYSEAVDGMATEPPYCNFWHWLLDLMSPPGVGIRRPSSFRLDIPKVLSTYDSVHAVQLEAEQAALAPMMALALAAVPAEFQKMAEQQNQPKPTKLQPFVKEILGHFQAEFGPVVKLNLRND